MDQLLSPETLPGKRDSVLVLIYLNMQMVLDSKWSDGFFSFSSSVALCMWSLLGDGL